MRIVSHLDSSKHLEHHYEKEKPFDLQQILIGAHQERAKSDNPRHQKDQPSTDDARAKADGLARMVARGEKINEQERAFVNWFDPELIDKALEAHDRAAALLQLAKDAKDANDAVDMLSSGVAEAQTMIQSDDPDYGLLLVEALSHLIEKAYPADEKPQRLELALVRRFLKLLGHASHHIDQKG